MTRVPLSRIDEEARLQQERLDLSIAEIDLQVRTTNCLEEKGILTVRDLLNSKPETLLTISNFGEKPWKKSIKHLQSLAFIAMVAG